MTTLDYSGILNRGVKGAGQTAINTMDQLQGMRHQREQMQMQKDAIKAEQDAKIAEVALRDEGANLLQQGTADEIAAYGIKNPKIMKDFMQAANFKDESALKSRIQYSQDIISGAVNPRKALEQRIEDVESGGGDASGLRKTLEGDDAGIIEAANKDLAVIAPSMYQKYRKTQEVNAPSGDTQKMKNFNEYQRLKSIDPDAAKKFGRSAGITGKDEKRIFQIKSNPDGTVTKYYSDGSEDISKPNEKVKAPDMKNAMTPIQARRIVDKAKEGQLKNAGFAMTLKNGLDTMNEKISEGYDPTNASWVNSFLAGTVPGNIIMSEDDQVYVGAVESMINAIARRETGAAITDFEKKDFFNRYMPTAGDTAKRTAQKKKALESQFKSIRGQSGSTYDAIRLTQGLSEDKPTQEIELKVKPKKIEGKVTLSDEELVEKWSNYNG